jgi:hypothetical protein
MTIPIEAVLMRKLSMNYVTARNLAADGRIVLGMNKNERWTPKLMETCLSLFESPLGKPHRQQSTIFELMKTPKGNSVDEKISHDSQSVRMSKLSTDDCAPRTPQLSEQGRAKYTDLSFSSDTTHETSSSSSSEEEESRSVDSALQSLLAHQKRHGREPKSQAITCRESPAVIFEDEIDDDEKAVASPVIKVQQCVNRKSYYAVRDDSLRKIAGITAKIVLSQTSSWSTKKLVNAQHFGPASLVYHVPRALSCSSNSSTESRTETERNEEVASGGAFAAMRYPRRKVRKFRLVDLLRMLLNLVRGKNRSVSNHCCQRRPDSSGRTAQQQIKISQSVFEVERVVV